MLDYSKLNEEQLEAVTWVGAPLLLLAGPGSGKTFTIVNRILFLLENGISPEKILVITFTKDAAVSMRNRFQQSTSKEYPVNFGTFHSIFYHILRDSLGIHQCKVLTNNQKKQIIGEIIKRKCRKYISNDTFDINEIIEKLINAFSFYKNTEDKERTLKKVPEIYRDQFWDFFSAYQLEMKKKQLIDFDDMLYQCKLMLEQNGEIREYWKSRFSHILIDEFQDTNPIQYEIIKLISNKRDIFVVGDDDQSIYGFRGANPDILSNFQKDFNAKVLLLKINYRSKPEIIENSLAVISGNKKRFEKKLRSSAEKEKANKDYVVVVNEFTSKDKEMDYLIRQVQDNLQKKQKMKCAVLFRTNYQIQICASELKKKEIKFTIKEKTKSIYENFIVKDVMSYLKLSHNIGTREDVIRVITTPNQCISRESIEKGFSKEIIKEWYQSANLSDGQKQQIYFQVDLLFRQLECMRKMSLHLAIQYILKALNYESYLRRKSGHDIAKYEEWQEIIRLLKKDSLFFPSLQEWIRFQQDYQEKICNYQKSDEEEAVIQLMTVHASKGLEYDIVFIPDCNEKTFPYGTLPDEETVEEERRLFYVAMTRAKEKLELLYLLEEGSNRKQKSRFLSKLEKSAKLNKP